MTTDKQRAAPHLWPLRPRARQVLAFLREHPDAYVFQDWPTALSDYAPHAWLIHDGKAEHLHSRVFDGVLIADETERHEVEPQILCDVEGLHVHDGLEQVLRSNSIVIWKAKRRKGAKT